MAGFLVAGAENQVGTRRLTKLNDRAAMRTFDITPDGKQIVFDRLRENSSAVLIDWRARPE